MTCFVAVAALSISISPARAKDVLLTVLQSDSGEKSVHYQAIDHDRCIAFLDYVRNRRAAGVPITLTLLDPEFTGLLIRANCVKEDGTIIGLDGVVKQPPAKP